MIPAPHASSLLCPHAQTLLCLLPRGQQYTLCLRLSRSSFSGGSRSLTRSGEHRQSLNEWLLEKGQKEESSPLRGPLDLDDTCTSTRPSQHPALVDGAPSLVSGLGHAPPNQWSASLGTDGRRKNKHGAAHAQRI